NHGLVRRDRRGLSHRGRRSRGRARTRPRKPAPWQCREALDPQEPKAPPPALALSCSSRADRRNWPSVLQADTQLHSYRCVQQAQPDPNRYSSITSAKSRNDETAFLHSHLVTCKAFRVDGGGWWDTPLPEPLGSWGDCG